jgi:hypothetical protein
MTGNLTVALGVQHSIFDSIRLFSEVFLLAKKEVTHGQAPVPPSQATHDVKFLHYLTLGCPESSRLISHSLAFTTKLPKPAPTGAGNFDYLL